MSDVRLIDANRLKMQSVEVDIVTPPHNHYCSELVVFDYDIDDAPTIDAVPVMHGRWLTSSYIPDTLICSVCGKRFDMYHYDQKDMPFCLCGAKMDGGADNG